MRPDTEVGHCPKPGVRFILFYPHGETEAQLGESDMLEIIEQKPEFEAGSSASKAQTLGS